MSFSVNTNGSALNALQNLNSLQRQMATSQDRLNTGLAVTTAKGNPSLYSIAQTMRGKQAGLTSVQQSLDRGISELDVAIAAGEAISDLLIEMKEKAVSAKDGGLDTASRTSLNDDYSQLNSQINTIVQSASFNGTNLLNGDSLSVISDDTGSSANTLSKSISSMSIETLGLSATTTITPREFSGTVSLSNVDYTQIVPTFTASADGSNSVSAVNNFIADNEAAIEAQYDSANGSGSYASADKTVNADGTINDASYADAVVLTMRSVYGTDELYYGNENLTEDYPVIFWDGTSSTPFYIVDDGSDSYFTTDGSDVTVTGSNSIATASAASSAVDTIEAAITTVNQSLSELGAMANRLEIQQVFTNKLYDGIDVGIGNLVDADMAKESAILQSLQTKQQLGLQALSIANQAPQATLTLFR